MSELDKITRQYEGKLATLTAINSALKSENATLRRDLDKASAPRSEAEQELLELKQEFTARLGQYEKKINGMKDERDRLRSQLQAAAKGGSASEARLQEKDDYIASLRKEGESLSRKNGELEAAARKLRSSVREIELERDKAIARADNLQAELYRVQENSLRETQSAQGQVEELERELQRVKREAQRQVADAQKKANDAVRDAQSKASVDEEKAYRALCEREAMMAQQLQDMRNEVEMTVARAQQREATLQDELERTQHQVRQLESAHLDVQAKSSDATRPLLRQIESLTATNAAQLQAAKDTEWMLQQRLQSANEAVSHAQLQAKRASERAAASESALAAAGEATTTARQEAAAATTALQSAEAKCLTLHHEVDVLREQLESSKDQVQALEEEIRACMERLWDSDERRRSLQHDLSALTLAAKAAVPASGPGRGGCETSTPPRSANGMAVTASADDVSVGSISQATPPPPVSYPAGGLLDGLTDSSPVEPLPVSRTPSVPNGSVSPAPGGSNTVTMLQHHMSLVEAARDRANDELLASYERLEAAELRVQELQRLCDQQEQQLMEVQATQDMALELLGERNERVEQLEEDVQEMKAIFHRELDNAVQQMFAAQQELQRLQRQNADADTEVPAVTSSGN